MSVKLSFMTAARMLSVTTPLVVSPVHVSLHSLAMEKNVKVSKVTVFNHLAWVAIVINITPLSIL